MSTTNLVNYVREAAIAYELALREVGNELEMIERIAGAELRRHSGKEIDLFFYAMPERDQKLSALQVMESLNAALPSYWWIERAIKDNWINLKRSIHGLEIQLTVYTAD